MLVCLWLSTKHKQAGVGQTQLCHASARRRLESDAMRAHTTHYSC